MLRLLLQLVTKGFHGFRLSCILSTIIHYKAIIINLTSITFLLFPSERAGYGSRLFAHGMGDDCSITWSNIKFDEHDLLPGSQHQFLLFRKARIGQARLAKL